jgi:predicted nucleotidyltransferase
VTCQVRPIDWGVNSFYYLGHFPVSGKGNMSDSKDALDLLGLSAAGARIFRYFMVRPGTRMHVRKLRRLLRLGGSSLQRELARLLQLGALSKETEGNRTVYRANEDAPVWRAIRILESSTADPSRLVEDALVDVEGLEAAFIFGSVARGEHRADSDLDLFAVEAPGAQHKKLLRQLAEVGLVLGCEINAITYTPQELADRLGDATHPAWGFVREVLTGPKRWVHGSAAAIAPLASAAGVTPDELSGAAA